ncbi:hypothetical protein JHFBIEKO_2155 [Methylobacterium mesophilicum]|nr:hypothetical protein JHFBIEKO_2155 [Methylobacterium mesophilicum]
MHATCRICRRRRPMMANSHIYFPCSVGTFHSCPSCDSLVAGSGEEPCYACGLRLRSELYVAALADLIRPPWLAELFTDFCKDRRIPLASRKAVEQVHYEANVCLRIADETTNPGELTTDVLRTALGPKGTRPVASLVAFMVKEGLIAGARGGLQVLVEEDNR